MTRRRHPREGLRERWVSVVIRARIDGETRALLLYLALRMGERGTVHGVTREDLAVEFNVAPRRVAERFQRAQTAGLLTRAGGGWNGHPAIWQATFPAPGQVEGIEAIA